MGKRQIKPVLLSLRDYNHDDMGTLKVIHTWESAPKMEHHQMVFTDIYGNKHYCLDFHILDAAKDMHLIETLKPKP
jgi:hypothetical protein